MTYLRRRGGRRRAALTGNRGSMCPTPALLWCGVVLARRDEGSRRTGVVGPMLDEKLAASLGYVGGSFPRHHKRIFFFLHSSRRSDLRRLNVHLQAPERPPS